MITTQGQVDCCNQALRALGEKAIALPSDATNPRWLLAQEYYDQVQDTLFASHHWNFATVRAVLQPAVAVTPAWGWTRAFALPGDYVAVQRVETAVAYQREGQYFLSDEPTLSLTYTRRLTDVTLWPAIFKSAFVAALAAAFAEQITGQQGKLQLWLQLAEARLRRAKTLDGQEGTPPRVQALELIIARHGGWRGPGYRW
jgi:hypothetical protein